MAVDDYNKAVLHGIVKIASKMGVSTIQSYESAQIFEIVGIRKDVVDQYFTNTVSRVGGVGLEEIAEGTEYYPQPRLRPPGAPDRRRAGQLRLPPPALRPGKRGSHVQSPGGVPPPAGGAPGRL